MPPHIANTSRTGSWLGVIDAGRRSISQPPMIAVASPPLKSCELFTLFTPPRIAVADNSEFDEGAAELLSSLWIELRTGLQSSRSLFAIMDRQSITAPRP